MTTIMNNNNKLNIKQRQEEDDDVPLVQYLLDDASKKYNPTTSPKRQQPQPQQAGYFNYPTLLNTQQLPNIHRRPSYPTTPSSLLDTFSDDEDDEDLVPIGFISTQRKGHHLQSAAEKYKEKVKAQLINDITIQDDDDLPLSKIMLF